MCKKTYYCFQDKKKKQPLRSSHIIWPGGFRSSNVTTISNSLFNAVQFTLPCEQEDACYIKHYEVIQQNKIFMVLS